MMEPSVAALPADVLRREDVRLALAEHDFAAAFALFGKYGGISQNRIASACQLTPGKVSLIVHGRAQVTSFEVVCRIADGLRIPGHMLGLAPRKWEDDDAGPARGVVGSNASGNAGTAGWTGDASVALASKLTTSDLGRDKPLPQRPLSGGRLLDSMDGWLGPATLMARPRQLGRLGMREVEEFEASARAFRAWDRRVGGGLHRKAVLGQLSVVAGFLHEHQSPQVEQGLFQLMAELAGTAATMAWDSGLHHNAQQYCLAPG
ncbi:hypothetical protein GCM10027059_25110 [Myceligenerans halotolerans]